MKKPALYTKSGAPSKATVSLDTAIFDQVPETHELLRQAYDSYLANGRSAHAKTKLRGEVRGGGRKPWKQKGTGRARVGSIRSPIWRGGGITFGPTGEQNYQKKMHKQAKQSAVKQALSLSLENGKIHVIESFELKEGKTKEVSALLSKIGISKNVVLVVQDKNDSLRRAAQNISEVSIVQATYLNVFDILNADSLVIEKAALEGLQSWLGGDA